MAADHPKGGGRAAPATGWRVVLAAVALAALVLLGVGLGFSEFGRNLDPEVLIGRIRNYGAWGAVAVVALMVVHSFVPFPAEILALCAGAVYGTIWGTALIWAGAMAGAALSFGLARWLGRPFVTTVLGPERGARVDAWTAEQGAAALLVARFVPVIAFNLINYAAGLTRVGWGTFLWTTGLGILPLTLVMVWMGSAMVTLSWPWLLGVSAAGMVVICGGHWCLRRRGWTGGRSAP